jgi:hypothetical protein
MKINWRLIRIPTTVKRVLMIVVAIILCRFLLPGDHQASSRKGHRMEQVRTVDWSAVDKSVRDIFMKAGARAEESAKVAVRAWTKELRQRAEEDFIPWYFSYWNQQAMALKAIGFHLMKTPAAEGLFGKQPKAEEQIESMVEKAFVSRVLQPATAQLKIEAITREAVTVYLDTLNQELKAVQADYNISEQDWERFLDGIGETVCAVEGNRQVPLILKGATVASGVVAVKIGQAVTAQIRNMILRRGSQEMMEHSMMYAGRAAARGFGGIAFVTMTGWELYDHQRTVAQNLPVMRKLLSDYFDQLESLVLNDSQCGILQTLERVRRMVAEQYKGA